MVLPRFELGTPAVLSVGGNPLTYHPPEREDNTFLVECALIRAVL